MQARNMESYKICKFLKNVFPRQAGEMELRSATLEGPKPSPAQVGFKKGTGLPSQITIYDHFMDRILQLIFLFFLTIFTVELNY